MSESCWSHRKLGEIIQDIGDGGTPPRAESRNFGGQIPWVVVDDIKWDIYDTKETLSELGASKSSAKLWHPGTIILSTGATIGKVGIARVQLCTKQGIHGIVCDESVALSEYVAYFLQCSCDKLNSLAQGSTIKEIRAKQICSLEIPLPPLPEQKKIAEILSGIDRELTSLQRHAEKLRLTKDEVIASFFSEASKDGFAEIRSFGEIVTGSTPPTSNPLNYGGMIPFISPGDIGDSAIVLETKSSLSAAGAANSRIIPPSSVCVVCIGSTIGKVALTATKSATNQQINALAPGSYDPFFMLAAISHMKKEIRNAASTHAVPIINKSRFGEILIPKPSIEKQRQFGNYISSSHKMLSHIMTRIQKYQHLKSALSADLLSGRKRVRV